MYPFSQASMRAVLPSSDSSAFTLAPSTINISTQGIESSSLWVLHPLTALLSAAFKFLRGIFPCH